MPTTSNTKVILTDVRLSYVNLLSPKDQPSGESKYSCMVLIPKDRKDLYGQIIAAIKEAYREGTSSKWQGKPPAWETLKHPVRDGDKEHPEDGDYKGCWYMNCSSKTKPGVLGPDGNKLTGVDDEVYSGMYGHVSVNFFPYSANGNRGVACGLNNVMKTKDGPRLGGRAAAESDFAAFLPDEGEAVAPSAEGGLDAFLGI